jgi:glycosyltransferase involved in cell wall biosynthesis
VRIAIVSDTYVPQVNGVSTVVRRSVDALLREGHETAVVAPRYPSVEETKPGELRVVSFPFPPYPAIRLSAPRYRSVAAFLAEFRPELIHVHTEGPLGLLGRRYALERRLPLVTSFHTDFPRYAKHYGAGVLTPLVWRWLRWFHEPAALTLTPGEGTQHELVQHGITKSIVWGRGVDPRLFSPARREAGWRRWLSGGDDTTVVLHVGRLAREKGLDVLTEAWRLARKSLAQRATFVVAGEGPLAERLVADLPFVRQLGFLPRERLAALYASSDICVLPSTTETCGLVALEAMASGVAVIAADAGGLRENVRDRETGILVPPRDPAGFAEAIEALVADPRRRFALSAAARELAVQRDSAIEDTELLTRYAELAHPKNSEVTSFAA